MYHLSLVLCNGEQRELDLDCQHQLTPDNVRPHALVYWLDNKTYNIPFTSIVTLSFVEQDYNTTMPRKGAL